MKTPRCFLLLLALLAGPAGLRAQTEESAPPADPLEETLQVIEGCVELHEWLTLLDMADPDHRQKQIATGMSHAQYLAELLGLNYEGNTLAGSDGRIDQNALSRIRQIEWKRRKSGDGWLTVLGTVSLMDGAALILEIHLKKRGDDYVLTGAAG